MADKFVSYYRVSTQEQGRSGLGLEAQQEAVLRWLSAPERELVGEYTDIESGKKDARPELLRAIAHAKRVKAILIIAKLDRLSRKVAFVSNLMEAGVRFVAVDNPSANELTIHILAAVAQAERKAISERTSAALQAAKARGTILGNPRLHIAQPKAVQAVVDRAVAHATNVQPIIEQLRAAGCKTYESVANAMSARGIRSARGGEWTATSVRRVELRASAHTAASPV